MSGTAFLDAPPQSDVLTPYDEQHLVTYLRLLDADREGAQWQEIARVIFDVCPDAEPDRAMQLHVSHLARAKWMTTCGYRDLLDRAKAQ